MRETQEDVSNSDLVAEQEEGCWGGKGRMGMAVHVPGERRVVASRLGLMLRSRRLF
jgi:hypothetical protein